MFTRPPSLTRSEAKVFALIYLESRHIARILSYSVRTVESKITFIKRKLGVNTRVAALWKGMSFGFPIDDQYLHSFLERS